MTVRSPSNANKISLPKICKPVVVSISRSAKEALAALQQVREEELYPASDSFYALFDGVEGHLKMVAAGYRRKLAQWCLKHRDSTGLYLFTREMVDRTLHCASQTLFSSRFGPRAIGQTDCHMICGHFLCRVRINSPATANEKTR